MGVMKDDVANLKRNVLRIGGVYLLAIVVGLMAPILPEHTSDQRVVHVGELFAVLASLVLVVCFVRHKPKHGARIGSLTSRANSIGDSGRVAIAAIGAIGFGALNAKPETIDDFEAAFASGSFLLAVILLLISWQIQKVKALSRRNVLPEEEVDFERQLSQTFFLRNETYDLLSGALVTFGLTYIFAAGLT